MDFSQKEMIGMYYYTNVNDGREGVKTVSINGREYLKFGTFTSTTAVAIQYKVFNPSVEHSEYITLIGVARQNPGDITLDKELGYEIATENAMINPVATIKYAHKCNEADIENLMRAYITGLPEAFIKTKKEIEADGNDVSRFNRNIRNDGDYFAEYYREYKKMFRKSSTNKKNSPNER